MLLKNGIIIPMVAKVPPGANVQFSAGHIIVNENLEPSMHIVRKGENYDSNMGYKRLHLYLFVKEDVKKGDWILSEDSDEDNINIVRAVSREEDTLKLVATTNTKFPIARLPKLFLNEYVDCGGGIDRTMVVYKEEPNGLVPEVNSRNIIKLGKTKDCHTGEEVAELIERMVAEVYDGKYIERVKQWTYENV